MDMTILTAIGAVAVIGGAGYAALYYYRKKSNLKLFKEVHDNLSQVPKKKQRAFVLMMFREGLSPENIKKRKKSKNEKTGFEKLNNQKYVEIQLVKMTSILKDPSKVKDRTTKSALKLYNQYLAWEKSNKAS